MSSAEMMTPYQVRRRISGSVIVTITESHDRRWRSRPTRRSIRNFCRHCPVDEQLRRVGRALFMRLTRRRRRLPSPVVLAVTSAAATSGSDGQVLVLHLPRVIEHVPGTTSDQELQRP